MITASGFVEAAGSINLKRVQNELKRRGMEINDIIEERIVFLCKGETIDSIKAELASLRECDYIKDVYLAYYHLQSNDQGNTLFSGGNGSVNQQQT